MVNSLLEHERAINFVFLLSAKAVNLFSMQLSIVSSVLLLTSSSVNLFVLQLSSSNLVKYSTPLRSVIFLFSTSISVTLFNSSCDKVPSWFVSYCSTNVLKVASGKLSSLIATSPSAITGVMMKLIKIIIIAKTMASRLSFLFFIVLPPL